MVFIILCVAILNLALGFALAVYLQGGAFDWAAVRGLRFGRKVLSWTKDPEAELEDPTEADSKKIDASSPVAETIDESPSSRDETLDTPHDDEDASLAFRSLAAALPKTESPSDEDWDRSDSRTDGLEVDNDAITAAIEGMKSELSRYRSEITTLDGRLRRCAAVPDAKTIQACASDLQRANEKYLQEHDARRDQLRSMPICRDLAQAADEQATAVVSAQASLAKLDFETDLLAQCHEMLNETRQLSETSENLHSYIGEVLDTLAETTGEQAAERERTPAVNARPAFVAAVESWWQANAAPNRRLAAALIEPDHLDRLTAEHGQPVVDQVLKAFDDIVTVGLAAGQTVARPDGDAYLLLLPDASPRDAVRVVERSRQQLDATRFRHGNTKLHLTVSCAVADSDRIKDAAPLVKRLEAMLAEAKRYGRNRTFFQEGDIPAPVVPPALSIKPQVIDLVAFG